MLQIDALPLARKLEQVDQAYAQLGAELEALTGRLSANDGEGSTASDRLKQAEENYHLQLLSLSMLVRTQIERALVRESTIACSGGNEL